MKPIRLSLSVALASVAMTFAACRTDTPVGVVGDNNPFDASVPQTDGGRANGGNAGTTQGQGGKGGSPSQTPAGGAAGMATTITSGDLPFTNPDDIQSRWTGYFENFTLPYPSTSDAIQLVFTKDAAGNTALAVVLGSGTPPPPTDPEQSWPIETKYVDGMAYPSVVEGTYPAHEVNWTGRRLRFKLAGSEIYAPWCALQPSYPVGDGAHYNCIPGITGGAKGDGCFALGPNSSVLTAVPCGRYYMCVRDLCACDATGCGPNPKHDMPFDITFSDGLGSGSAVLDTSGSHALHIAPN